MAEVKRGLRAALAVCACVACDRGELPAYGEALVIVDTDMPVPRLASRVRVDFYDAKGTWYESRDLARPDPRDFPVSFGVWSPDENASRVVFVRVRLYAEGKVRDYRGEHPDDPASPDAPLPRLVKDGRDVTPVTEPDPALAIDRLVEVHLVPCQRGSVRLTLRGACVATPVRLTDESCVDRERTREPVRALALDASLALPPASLLGTWGVEACDASAATPTRVCVPGGPFVMGTRIIAAVPDFPAQPERMVRVSRFLIDRDEVTVSELRAGVASGFVPPAALTANEGPLTNDSQPPAGCTWSAAPREREGHAVTCVPWKTARAFCQWRGGDLPSEAQWEYAATAAGRPDKTLYPWGDDPPTCDRAVYGRLDLGSAGLCTQTGIGPLPTGARPADATPLGIVGLAGGVGEWTRDVYAQYTDACWTGAPVADPVCDRGSLQRSLRGGSWAAPLTILRSAARMGHGEAISAPFEGFRCVYPTP